MPISRTDGAISESKRALGVVAGSKVVHWTLVEGTYFESPSVDDELSIEPPANLTGRGELLAWIYDEVVRRLASSRVDWIVMEQPGASVGRDRAEVEAMILVAACKANVPNETRTKDSARARLGRPAGAGSFRRLLDEPDVKARSNEAKRLCYVFAKTALRVAGAK